MKGHAKIGIITVVVAIPAFILGHLIWPPSPDMLPTYAQLPWLMGMAAIEALAFGFGIAYLVTVWPMIASLPLAEKKKAIPPYLALGWLLVNWWPHDNLHAANGMNVAGLIRIEYGFHVTLIIAAIILVRWMVMTLVEKRSATAKPPAQ